MFYPAQPAVLHDDVRRYVAEGRDGAGMAKAVIAPHAGYIYSGPVAGSAYRHVDAGVRRVVLIGPAHFYPLGGMATHSAEIFSTPLGDVPVVHPPGIPAVDDAHVREHSLEVHLPFLQEVLLAADLIVVSSDLSHFLPYEEAQVRDASTVARIERGEPVGPYDACGCYSVGGLTELAKRRGWSAKTIDLRNSGDTAGDRNSVVGYAAIVY
jgi:predicted class III extradiol MEMO1 family dioxygenase